MAGLWQEMGDAIADIRQKVVEEPMWGRSLGENDAPSWPQAQEPEPSFGSSTHVREIEPDHSVEQESEHSVDMDMER